MTQRPPPAHPRLRGSTRVEIGSYKLELRPAYTRTVYDAYDRRDGTCIAREATNAIDAWLVFDARGHVLGTLEESTGAEPWVCQRVRCLAPGDPPVLYRGTRETNNTRTFELESRCFSGATWLDAVEYAYCRVNGIISENSRRVVR